jgi:hypothetical protein
MFSKPTVPNEELDLRKGEKTLLVLPLVGGAFNATVTSIRIAYSITKMSGDTEQNITAALRNLVVNVYASSNTALDASVLPIGAASLDGIEGVLNFSDLSEPLPPAGTNLFVTIEPTPEPERAGTGIAAAVLVLIAIAWLASQRMLKTAAIVLILGAGIHCENEVITMTTTRVQMALQITHVELSSEPQEKVVVSGLPLATKSVDLIFESRF